MSGKLKLVSTFYIEFENGYQVFFEPAGVTPYCVFVHIWHTGDKMPLEQFCPENANGYLKAEEFARLLFKMSAAPRPLNPSVEMELKQ